MCHQVLWTSDLEDEVEDSPQGSHEQENDTNSVVDTRVDTTGL